MLVHGMLITPDLQCFYALSRGTCLHVLVNRMDEPCCLNHHESRVNAQDPEIQRDGADAQLFRRSQDHDSILLRCSRCSVAGREVARGFAM